MSKKITKPKITTLSRPPIVTILGHVDHGKTTLLDAIRKTNVAGGEFGGITQRTGAYQVEVDIKEGKRKITFIDTPGHEAFSKMRSRGAAVTDLVVLVISAVDGVQPQTEESLKHINDAKVPFIVAATKMDLPEANLDRVHKHLAKIGVLTEGYGGEVVVLPVSAVSKKGIKELLEMILLICEMKGLKEEVSGTFGGIIIESRLDNKKGPVATILVKKGSLLKGEDIFLGEKKLRIRAMFDEYGKEVLEAGPSQPVEVLGFTTVPPVGEELTKQPIVAAPVTVQRTVNSGEEDDQKKLRIILKADTAGSLEAILGKLDKNIVIIETSIGDIGEAEILHAQTTRAIIIGFNVKIAKAAKKLAEEEKVLVKSYNIVYDLLEEIYEVSKYVLEGEKEEVLGEGRIIAIFNTSSGKIAGIKVISGRLAKGALIRLLRGDQVIGQAKINSLKQGKEDVSKVEQGQECGASFSANLDFAVDDMLLSVKIKEIAI